MPATCLRELIASETQMFTERYMVKRLLHNSLGQMWLVTCAKNGWTPDFTSCERARSLRIWQQ